MNLLYDARPKLLEIMFFTALVFRQGMIALRYNQYPMRRFLKIFWHGIKLVRHRRSQLWRKWQHNSMRLA